MIFGISINEIYSENIQLATFQETAQLIIDNKISENTTVSITLLSSNIQEIIFPTELEEKIRENGRIQAIILTNQNNCVLGVYDQSCIIINIERNPNDKGIDAIQESTKRIADLYIDEINQVFDTNAEFFQVFIHTDDKTNQQLKTSGIISGQGIIAAVYTMPMEDTDSMYGKLSSTLLSKPIRDGEGFYNIAKTLSNEDNAKMSFSLIPSDTKSLLQLRLSVEKPNEIEENLSAEINPLKFFNIKNLERSDYFSSGNYPLNSLFQIVILSNEETTVSNVRGDVIETKMIDGIKIPNQITKEGWIFDPNEGEQIQGKYIFGERTSINENELKFSLGEDNIQYDKLEFDESTITIIIIVIVSLGVAAFYLKGYKK
jgi:hypothetical protein|tara:strand:+ start:472 stop:1593 length:1122 start_codon:yes stop_codon:yes gene_type:complete